MPSEPWLEATTSELDEILRSEYGILVDRALLACLVDRRRENLARALHVSLDRAQALLEGSDLAEVAAHIAHAHRTTAVA